VRGFVPQLPEHQWTRYVFLTVSIVGATVSRICSTSIRLA
jgi:hypothetical protein